MCAVPLRGFVFVLSRLQISQAWIGARLSGFASEIQPPGHPPARTPGEALLLRVWAPSSTDFFFNIWVAFPDPASRRPRARIWGRKKKHFLGHTRVTPQIQRPGRPRARIWGGQSQKFWGRASRSNVQGALERGVWGQKTIFWGGHTRRSNVQGALERGFGGGGQNQNFGVTRPDPTSRAPSSADLRGGNTKLKILGVTPSKSNVRAPSSADLGGQKIWGVKPQIQRPGHPRAQGAKKHFWARASRSNVQGTLERRYGLEGKLLEQKNILKPQSLLGFGGGAGCPPPQIQRPGRPGAWIWGGGNREFSKQISKSNILSPLLPPNPRARAPWSADLGGQPAPPKSKLRIGV